MKNARRYCFTKFKDLLDDDALRSIFDAEDLMKFMICQLEISPTTGKEHLQGYLELTDPRKPTYIKTLFDDNSIHIEYCKGSADENIEYCSKDESRKEDTECMIFGSPNAQGKRTDLETIFLLIKSKTPIVKIAEEYPGQVIRYGRGLKDLTFILNKSNAQQFRRLTTVVLWGKAGSGKTRHVYDTCGFENVYKLEQDGSNQIWFDGYEGEDILLIDDFYGWIKYGYLLNILDGYPIRCPLKGGHTWGNWTKVFITSNKDPEDWYGGGCTPALGRRLTEITPY